jgi:hypothetical protein
MKNRRIGQCGQIGQSVGTIHTDSRIRRIGESGLTTIYRTIQEFMSIYFYNNSLGPLATILNNWA